jgi:hypothetical protein
MRIRSIGRDFSKKPVIIPRRGNQLRDRTVYPAIALPPGEQATKPRQCTIAIAGLTPSAIPQRCESRVFKAGRCVTHYGDWRAAREARGIEQRAFREHQKKAGKLNAHGRITPLTTRVEAVAKPYIPKAKRKGAKRGKVA